MKILLAVLMVAALAYLASPYIESWYTAQHISSTDFLLLCILIVMGANGKDK